LQPIFTTAAQLVQLYTPTRDPHQRGLVAQVVEDGTTDVPAGKGFKGLAPAWDVELGSAEQTQQAHLGEVIGRFPGDAGVMTGNWGHQIQAGLDS
jgi:hypothetical protein